MKIFSNLFANVFSERGYDSFYELHDGEKGRYIYMPLNPKRRKTRKNSSYPINNEAREQILKNISDEYDKELEE